jgi:von Willebrand factor type A domain
MNFAHPRSAIWFVGLAVLALCYIALRRYRGSRMRSLKETGFLQSLLLVPTRWRTVLAPVLIALCWTGAVLALMGPRGKAEPLASDGEAFEEEIVGQNEDAELLVQRKAHDVVFLLDASASMAVSDTRTGATRLELAKEIIDETVSHLSGQSAGLYAFTSEVASLVPPTVDYLYLRLMARKAGINEGDAAGTDLMEAFETLMRRFGGSPRNCTLVLLTDGGDTRLEVAEGEERTKQMEAILSRVDGKGVRVYTVGLGSHGGAVIPGIEFDGEPVHSTLDEELLRAVAQTGRGDYYFADDGSALSLAETLVQRIETDDLYEDETTQMESVEVERMKESDEPLWSYTNYFQIPIALAALFIGIELGLPERRRK